MLEGGAIDGTQAEQGRPSFVQQVESAVRLQAHVQTFRRSRDLGAEQLAIAASQQVDADHLVHIGTESIKLLRPLQRFFHRRQLNFDLQLCRDIGQQIAETCQPQLADGAGSVHQLQAQPEGPVALFAFRDQALPQTADGVQSAGMNALAEIKTTLPQSLQHLGSVRLFEQESAKVVGGLVEQTAYFVCRVIAGFRIRFQASQRIALGDWGALCRLRHCRWSWDGRLGGLRPAHVAPVAPLLPEAVEIDSRHHDKTDGQQAQLKFTHVAYRKLGFVQPRLSQNAYTSGSSPSRMPMPAISCSALIKPASSCNCASVAGCGRPCICASRARLVAGMSHFNPASNSSAESGLLHTSTMSHPACNAASARCTMPPATVAPSMLRSSLKMQPSKPSSPRRMSFSQTSEKPAGRESTLGYMTCAGITAVRP